MTGKRHIMWALFNYDIIIETGYFRREVLEYAKNKVLPEDVTWKQARRKGWLRITKVEVRER